MSLNELMTFRNGKVSPTRSSRLPHPVFGSNGIIGKSAETNSPGGTTIIGRVGSCGSLHFSAEPCWVTDNAIRATALGLNHPKFLFSLLTTLRLHDRRHGSAQPLINQSILSSIRTSVPPPDEQRAIAQILGTLDDRIELNHRVNESLEAIARALFKSWFVDFEPVRAKMVGRNIGLPECLDGIFPQTLNKQGKPVGWMPRRLDTLFDVSIGRTPPRKERQHFVPGGSGAIWLSIKTMGTIQTFATASEEGLTAEAIDRFRVPRIPAGTVMVSFKLTVGRVAIAASDMYSNEAIAQLRAKSDTPVKSPFTYCFMKEFNYDTLASTSSIGTAVNSKSIKGIEILLPDAATHTAFDAIAQPIFDRILSITREIHTLSNVRDELLPKLISGDIRITDAETLVETLT